MSEATLGLTNASRLVWKSGTMAASRFPSLPLINSKGTCKGVSDSRYLPIPFDLVSKVDARKENRHKFWP